MTEYGKNGKNPVKMLCCERVFDIIIGLKGYPGNVGDRLDEKTVLNPYEALQNTNTG